MVLKSGGLEKKLQAVMEQAVANNEVAGINLLVKKSFHPCLRDGRRMAQTDGLKLNV